MKKMAGGLACSSQSGDPPVVTANGFALIPLGKFSLGADVSTHRLADSYAEQRAGLTCAGVIGRQLAFGLKINYHGIAIRSYGNAAAWSVESGLQYALTPQLRFGAVISNPSSNGFDPASGAVVPVRIGLGSSYQLNEGLLVSAGWESNSVSGSAFTGGMEYDLMTRFSLRCGLASFPFSQSAGFGFRFGAAELAYSYTSARYPVQRSQISLGYGF